MPGRPDCATCDYRDRPETCAAADTPELCGLAARPEKWRYRDLIRRMTEAGDDRPDAATPPPRSEPDRPALRAQIHLDMAVNRCKARQAIGCGCADRSGLCFRSGLPFVATREHCGECVSRSGEAASV